jgi:tetratricopeptide (TPR) repeat protein
LNASIGAVSGLHAFTLMRDGYVRLRGASASSAFEQRPVLPVEVEALLDYRGGLEEYRRDETWRRNVIRQFRFNLHRMVQLARDAGVDVILMNPVSNIGDVPPFKAEHRPDLGAQELAQWESLLEAARGHFCRENYNLRMAIPPLELACKIDPLHAGGWYSLAECYRSVGRTAEARDAYLRAKELDVCPLRILQPMSQALLDVARETDTPLVNVERIFERSSPHGIVGSEQLVDHVHPSVAGHRRIADALLDKLVDLGRIRPESGWQARNRCAVQRHLDGLDDGYYFLGEQRLKNLQLWTQGRAAAVRPPAPNSGRRP